MQRMTRQRSAIRDVLAQTTRPLSADEVLLAARAQVPALSLATVYRTLKTLRAAGEIHSVDLPGESPRYEAAAAAPGARHAHHHHFQCSECGRAFRVDGCPGGLEALLPPGFRLTDHAITLYGQCAACAARPRRAAGRGAGAARPHSGT